MSENSVTSKSLQKFAESAADEKANKFGICNSRGQLVTNAYLSRYIQCWCRKENGFVKDRKANFTFFMSDQFLSTMVGKTASQVGKAASLDPRWGIHKPVTAADVPAQVAEQPVEPVFESTPDAGQPANEPIPQKIASLPKRMTKAERVALAEKIQKERDAEALRASLQPITA